jgi:hypothetical protein
MPNENPKLTITLTGRKPVTITKDDWDVIASAGEKEWDNQYEFQANRTASFKLTVRQHQDGRAIVYGVHSYNSQYQGEHGRDIRGGELLDKDADIPEAIHRVAAELESRMEDGQWSQGYWPRLAHECTADLPAVEI